MNKNVKSIFFVLTLLALLVAITTVTAADDANTNGIIDSSADVSDAGNDMLSLQEVQSTSDDNNVDTDNKIMKKDDKNIKTSTQTVEVNSYAEITTAINNAVNDADNDEYVINLNEGTYKISSNTVLNAGTYTPNIIINANGQTLVGSSNTRYVRFNNGCNITIDNANISHRIQNYANSIVLSNCNITNTMTNQPDVNLTLINSYTNGSITNSQGNVIFENSTLNNSISNSQGNVLLRNSTINGKITNNGNLTICDDVILAEGFSLTGAGQVIINNTSLIIPYLSVFNGNITIENMTIATPKTNEGNLTIRNSTLDAEIRNNGNLTICDDVIFGDNFLLTGSGELIINDTDRIIPYLSEFNIDYTLENMTIKNSKTNNANLTIKDSTISASITNNGNLTIKNTTIDAPITNNGKLIICNDCILGGNFELYGTGDVITNISEVTAGTTESITGTVTYNNAKFKKLAKINGNVTMINCTIDTSYSQWGMTSYNEISNKGNLSLINCTLRCAMNNEGDLIIDGGTPPKGIFTSNGRLEIANVNWLDITGTPTTGPWENLRLYSDTLIRNSTFSSITKQVIIYARTTNLTIINCQFNGFSGQFVGYSENTTLTISDSVINDNQASVSVFRTMNNIYMNNCSFENNTCDILSNINNVFIDNCTFINNSHVSTDIENINLNNSIFKNHSKYSILSARENSTITNCTFEDNSLSSDSPYGGLNGIAIKLLPTGNNIIQISDNIFKNNCIDAKEGQIIEGNYYQDFTRNGFGTDIAIGVSYINGYNTGNNSSIIITNNQFINSQTTQKAGAIFVYFNEDCENNSLTIKENTFENVKAKSETIIHNNTQNVEITDNSFINCSIDMDEFSLSSPQDGLTITPDTPITLNIQSILSNPEYYDSDLLTKSAYQIFINDENKYNTTENEFTFTSDIYGTLTINIANPAVNSKTNDVTLTVYKKELVVNEINARVGDKINITAQIRINDELYEQLNTGKMTFKVNGKTLKDANGKVIYAKVVNGTASIENYEVPDEWTEATSIQAIYSGSNQFEKITSEK
ncbi:MAG: right-handed parallel beta-helix repeat-containing protein, partial [Methanosphaera sp.]|nr:right-handed parallel beta-helix repeat-containing protein [Methanosphaera sp.]